MGERIKVVLAETDGILRYTEAQLARVRAVSPRRDVQVAPQGKEAMRAALDAFSTEPLPSNHPFYALPNVIITPHVAATTDRYDDRALDAFVDNLRRYLAGEPLRNVVDAKKGY
jgi:phosphoglycerate dehydrogenase-like enzyme